MAAKLLRTMYGTQDAARIWGETWIPSLEQHGIEVGLLNRFVFGNDYLRGLCHGDDFLVVASQKQLDEFGKILMSKFDVKQAGLIGFGPGKDKEINMLNRTIRIDDESECVELEPDAKHIKQMIEDLGLKEAKIADPLRTRLSVSEAHALKRAQC